MSDPIPLERTPPTPAGAPIDGAADPRTRLLTKSMLGRILSWAKLFGIQPGERMDFAQDVFVAALRTMHRFDRRRPLEPWLRGVALRQANHFRKKAYRRREIPRPSGQLDEVEAEHPSAEQALSSEEDRILVLEALDGLDPGLREVLLQHKLQEVPIKEIARARGMAQSTVYHWCERAERELQAAVRRLRMRRGDFRMVPFLLPMEALAFFDSKAPALEIAESVWRDVQRAVDALVPPAGAMTALGRLGRAAALGSSSMLSRALPLLVAAGIGAAMHAALGPTSEPLAIERAAADTRSVLPASEGAASASTSTGAVLALPAPAPPPVSPASDPGLATEESLLALAATALDRDDYAAARAALGRYVRAYPRGRYRAKSDRLLERLGVEEEQAQRRP